MSLRFITGSCGSGKTFYCLEEISQKQKQGNVKNLIYTVPEQNTLSAEKKLIAHTDGKCIMNAKVLSFKRLGYRVFSELGFSGKKILNDAGRLMAIRKIAFRNKERLEFFSSSLGKEGVLDRIDHSIRELFRGKVSPEDLNEIIEKTDKDSLTYVKLKDLAVIYSGYIDFLNEGYSSSEETLNILAEKIQESHIIKDSEIWIDGFYSFTPQELKIIEGMLLSAKKVNIVLNIEKEAFLKKDMDMSDIYYEPWLTADILFKMAKRLNVNIETSVFLENSFKYKTKGMKFFKENFPKTVPETSKDSKGVYIFAAADKYSEVEDTAEKINALVRDNGYRYRDIGVLSREVEDYSRIISGVFKEYEIPIFVDKMTDIKESAFIKFILSMLETVINDFSYEDVFSYIKTGLSPITDMEGDILENYVLKYGIKGKTYFESWSFGFEGDDIKKEYINGIRERVFLPFLRFAERIGANKKYPLNTIAEAFEEFLENVSAEEKIELLSESFEEAGDKKSAGNLKRSFKTAIDLINVLKEIIGEEKVNLKEFYGILEAGLSKSDLGFVPPENDLVVIGDLERTRLNDIKVLFVLGMNDGIIPKAPETMGIFSDTESEFFENLGAELTKGGKRAAFEENFLILMGLLQPSDILRLSYSVSDLKGSELRPSIIINKIKRIFPQIEVSSSEKYKDEISLAEPSLHKLSNMLSAGEVLSPSWEYVLNYTLKNEKFKDKVQNMLKAKEDSSFEKNISKESIGKLFGKRLNLSATGINLYSGCPFSYFVKYGLKAKERDVYEIKTPDLGSIFHSVLERFSNELSKDKISWADISKAEMEGIIERAVEDIAPAFSEKILLSKAGYRYLIKRLKKISKRAVWALSYHAKKGAFKPLGFEIGFGKGEALPPIIIKLDSGRELLMRGKIDRVDVFEKDGNSYVKIIDYKTSGKNFDLMSVYYGIELQLMLYMAEFAEAGNEILENEIIPGGIFYFAVKSGDMIPEETKTTLTADEIAKAMLKNFKMNGLILADNNVIDALDSEISGSSDIIPVRVNKDGSLSKTSGAVSKEEFSLLLDYSKEKVKEIGKEIYSGKISPSPYKINERSACTFCEYRSVCRFDSGKKADNFRILKKLKDKEVLELIKKEETER